MFYNVCAIQIVNYILPCFGDDTLETDGDVVLVLVVELDSKADVVVSLEVDDGSIVVEALPLVLADCKVDCNIDVGLDCVGLDRELEVDGVMFVD